MQKISTFLWFNDNAEEAANFYVSVFSNAPDASGNSKILTVLPGPGGKALGVSFMLDGQEFKALNGGPQFKFTEAISLFVNCDTQEEIDYFWENFTTDGGQESMCGWLKDKYGLSWQIIPPVLGQWLGDKDREKAGRAMQAMMGMQKLNIAELNKAFEGK